MSMTYGGGAWRGMLREIEDYAAQAERWYKALTSVANSECEHAKGARIALGRCPEKGGHIWRNDTMTSGVYLVCELCGFQGDMCC